MSSKKITKSDFLKMSKSEKGARLESRNEEALNALINDEDDFIRGSVATYGNDKHRDILINDEEWCVRKAVAMYGNDSHRGILVNDVIERVSEYAKKYMGSTVHILTKRFGTYNQANLLQIFENGYKIISNCYETDSLTEWINKARSQGLSEEVIEKEVEKINALLM